VEVNYKNQLSIGKDWAEENKYNKFHDDDYMEEVDEDSFS
jgi:hypothetical protein